MIITWTFSDRDIRMFYTTWIIRKFALIKQISKLIIVWGVRSTNHIQQLSSKIQTNLWNLYNFVRVTPIFVQIRTNKNFNNNLGDSDMWYLHLFVPYFWTYSQRCFKWEILIIILFWNSFLKSLLSNRQIIFKWIFCEILVFLCKNILKRYILESSQQSFEVLSGRI